MSTIRIAIDGPSGAGKSTLARSIAEKLGYLYVDTGAIYRTLGYHIYAKGLNPKDGTAVSAELPGLRVEMSHGRDGLQRMLLNGQDVTERIRLPENIELVVSELHVWLSALHKCSFHNYLHQIKHIVHFRTKGFCIVALALAASYLRQ